MWTKSGRSDELKKYRDIVTIQSNRTHRQNLMYI